MTDETMVFVVFQGVSMGAAVTIGFGALFSMICAGLRVFRRFIN